MFDPESHRAAAAAFEAKKVHQSLADVVESYLRAEFFRASSETNRYSAPRRHGIRRAGSNFTTAKAAVGAASQAAPDFQTLLRQEHSVGGPICRLHPFSQPGRNQMKG